MKKFIYGAQGIAYSTCVALEKQLDDGIIECFIVTSLYSNPKRLANKPVIAYKEFLNQYRKIKDEVEIYIATPENVIEEIKNQLEGDGFYNIISVDSNKYDELMGDIYCNSAEWQPIASIDSHSNGIEMQLTIYNCRHIMDSTINDTYHPDKKYIDIQVGTALTDRRVAKLTDDLGDNISKRNGKYSELTALYWIWKNVLLKESNQGNKYYGLSHYRRHFILQGDDWNKIKEVDVLLPYPLMYEPNIEEHHRRYMEDRVWDAVWRELILQHPDKEAQYRNALNQQCFYNYNIIIAKESVLYDYCEWLFNILLKLEEELDAEGVELKRTMGYIAETLETIYFFTNKDKLTIAHAGIKMLI